MVLDGGPALVAELLGHGHQLVPHQPHAQVAVGQDFEVLLDLARQLFEFAGDLVALQPGQPVPVSVEAQGYTFPVEWYDTSGTARTIRDYLGTVTLIQFWRTRCPACVLEVPALDKLAPQLEGPKFRLIAIALKEDSLSDIERFYARYQIRNLEILHDRDHLAFSQIAPAHPYYGVRSTPTTVLVDPRGNYISAYSGVPGWEKPEGVALLKWIIDNA
ncbi:MAG: TlpA disulfide reductase family protein [Alphaproteobacteria bacterium]